MASAIAMTKAALNGRRINRTDANATATIATWTAVVKSPWGIQPKTMPGASTAVQSKRSHNPQPSLAIGRQKTASTSRIGYSATQEKTTGANQAGEQAADHAAGGNGQIERRQML